MDLRACITTFGPSLFFKVDLDFMISEKVCESECVCFNNYRTRKEVETYNTFLYLRETGLDMYFEGQGPFCTTMLNICLFYIEYLLF